VKNENKTMVHNYYRALAAEAMEESVPEWLKKQRFEDRKQQRQKRV